MKCIDKNRNRPGIESKLVVTKGEREAGRDKLGAWDEQIQTTVYQRDKQQGFTV